MDTHLKLYTTQLKQLNQTQTHLFHDRNAYSDSARNMKATTFHNNEHTNIIISEPDLALEECRENFSLNTFTPPSSHNTSIPERTTKLLTPHLMIFIHQNKHYHAHAYKTGTA